MGLFSRLVLAPLAPVAGVVWLARQLEEVAWQQMHDPAALRAELVRVQQEYESGAMTLDELEQAENLLLARLEESGAGSY
jgi:hypothetical protein